MKPVFLDFEQPIAELTNKIEELRFVQGESAVDISDEIARLQKKSNDLTKSIFNKLTPAQISQVSRHPQRPYTLDYIQAIFTDFEELARRPPLFRRPCHRRWFGALQRTKCDGYRPSKRSRYQRKNPP